MEISYDNVCVNAQFTETKKQRERQDALPFRHHTSCNLIAPNLSIKLALSSALSLVFKTIPRSLVVVKLLGLFLCWVGYGTGMCSLSVGLSWR